MLCLYSFWKSLSLSNSTYNIALSFAFVANLLFKLLTSKFKFPILRLTITTLWNNYIALSICITFATTSSIDFGVLVYAIRFLDPFVKDPYSYINLFPNPNSNDFPFVNPSPIDTCRSGGLNIATWVCVPNFSVYILVACRPACVCCCCSYYWCYKCCGLSLLSI
jgi:hypothetical protein